MIIRRLELGPLSTNTYILAHGGECIVVDPAECIAGEVEELGCRETLIVVTHGHFDHTQGVDCLKRRGALLAAHPLEPEVARESSRIARAWGIPAAPQESRLDEALTDGSRIRVAGLDLTVVHTPGHSPDHIILYTTSINPPIAIVGDLIFRGSIGRVDLPGSSPGDMRRSLERVKSLLPGEARILPGHGPETLMSIELRRNPFLLDPSLI